MQKQIMEKMLCMNISIGIYDNMARDELLQCFEEILWERTV